jgi:hypothetical protein
MPSLFGLFLLTESTGEEEPTLELAKQLSTAWELENKDARRAHRKRMYAALKLDDEESDDDISAESKWDERQQRKRLKEEEQKNAKKEEQLHIEVSSGQDFKEEDQVQANTQPKTGAKRVKLAKKTPVEGETLKKKKAKKVNEPLRELQPLCDALRLYRTQMRRRGPRVHSLSGQLFIARS